MADLYDLFGEDPAAAQIQARALADAMQRRRAAGTVATIIGGPFAQAGRAFLGDADQTGAQVAQAGQYQGQQRMLRGRMAQDAAQHQAQLAAQAAVQAEAARHNAATEGLARSAQEQDAWSATPDPLGGVVMFNRKTGETRPLGPQNPGAGGPRLPNFKTEGQANAFGFAGRIREARKQMEEAGYPSGLAGRVDSAAMGANGLGPLSGVVPQEAASEPGSRYFNAARNLVAALLRKESGAAIGKDEWSFAIQNYIPTPADSPELRANKLKMLDIMEQAMVASAGPAGAAALQEPQGPALAPGEASGGTPASPSAAAPSVDDLLKKYGAK